MVERSLGRCRGPLQPGDFVALGFDGSRRGDASALVAVRIFRGDRPDGNPDMHIELLGVWEKPDDAGDDWQVDREGVDAAVASAMKTYGLSDWLRGFLGGFDHVGVVETTRARADRAPGCDFGGDGPGPMYQVGVDGDGLPVWGCRCLVCSRCGRHTGNTTQGHYWALCTRSGHFEVYHFCCPDDCELSAGVVHACPPKGSGLTSCCGRSPAELPRIDVLTLAGGLVTCAGAGGG